MSAWWSFQYNPPPLEKPVVAIDTDGEPLLVKLTDKLSDGGEAYVTTDISGRYSGNIVRHLLWWTTPPEQPRK